ncbi:MAG: VOC family protein [Candidatus Zixiibacteriota bacterium]
MQTEVTHFGISVVNLDEAVNWYKENFGAGEIKRTYKKDLGLSMALLELGNLDLELLQPDRPEQTTTIEGTLQELLQRVGASHIAVTVSDVKGVYEKLQSTGAEMVTGLFERRLFFCRDPNGVLIEVKQKN